MVKAQTNLINPPYMDYSGPYVVKIHTRFLERANNRWATNSTAADLKSRAEKTLIKLNNSFNPYKIYFVWKNLSCDNPSTEIFLAQNGDDVSNFPSSGNAIDIYDEDIDSAAEGVGKDIPSNVLHLFGKNNKIPAAHMNIVVHEMGHLLGLFHPHHTQINCNEFVSPTVPANCSNGDALCNCCGDFVCDTRPFKDTNFKCTTGNDDILNNYMSIPADDNCRTLFTPEQTRRMWAYLSTQQSISILQNVQALSTISTSTVIAQPATYGNILVEKGATLDINADIKMLYRASIRVEKGAKLNVNAKITAACEGKMWQGIIIEGDINKSQDNTGTMPPQGEVTIQRPAIIEYAKVGVDVQYSFDSRYAPNGGGILRVSGGKFVDNEIGLRFGPYDYHGMRNESRIYTATFTTTNEYAKYSVIKPTYIKLNGKIIQLRVQYACKFIDERTNITTLDKRANGIEAFNASFVVQNCKFTNLDVAIYGDKLDQSIGSFVVSSNTFEKCVRGLKTDMYDGFNFYSNKIFLDDNLPNLNAATYIGAQINNKTGGFLFAENKFEVPSASSPIGTFIGTDCYRLGTSANIINKNQYKGLQIGNRARANNGDDQRGLLYTCNMHTEGLVTDYEIENNASIRKVQAAAGNGAAANFFSDDQYTIQNNGKEIDYYYYDGNLAEHPSAGSGFTGSVNEKKVLTMTSCEVKQTCNPCDLFSQQSSRFYTTKSSKDSLSLIYNTTTDSITKVNLSKSMLWKRFDMDDAANFVIQSYAQDTTHIQTDSIIAWYKRLETFDADLIVAKHYFFNQQFSAFEQIWNAIPNKYQLNATEQYDYAETTDLYSLLRLEMTENYSLYTLPKSFLNTLMPWGEKCSYSGAISRIILRRNNIVAHENCSPIIEKKAFIEPLKSSKNIKYNIYPNPANTLFNVDFDTNLNGQEIFIRDINGKTVNHLYVQPNILHQEVMTSQYEGGIYILEIKPKLETSTFHKIILLK